MQVGRPNAHNNDYRQDKAQELAPVQFGQAEAQQQKQHRCQRIQIAVNKKRAHQIGQCRSHRNRSRQRQQARRHPQQLRIHRHPGWRRLLRPGFSPIQADKHISRHDQRKQSRQIPGAEKEFEAIRYRRDFLKPPVPGSGHKRFQQNPQPGQIPNHRRCPGDCCPSPESAVTKGRDNQNQVEKRHNNQGVIVGIRRTQRGQRKNHPLRQAVPGQNSVQCQIC